MCRGKECDIIALIKVDFQGETHELLEWNMKPDFKGIQRGS